MSNRFAPRVGAVFSADIAVPEHEREKRFYSRVLTTGDTPLWRDDLMSNLGIPIIGLGAASPEYADLPVQWMPHIQVADVGASVRMSEQLGGKTLMHMQGDTGASQWAVLQDPAGATFGLIPIAMLQGAPTPPVSDAPAFGYIAWLDLTVPDAESARAYYSQVIGWTSRGFTLDDDGERYEDYGMVDANDNIAAGICHARGENRALPPAWLIYLPVGNITESLRLVEEEGGRIIKRSFREDGIEGYAVVQDPIGIAFALLRPE